MKNPLRLLKFRKRVKLTGAEKQLEKDRQDQEAMRSYLFHRQ